MEYQKYLKDVVGYEVLRYKEFSICSTKTEKKYQNIKY